MFEQTLRHSKPLESTTDSETASAQFSSSEDLVVVGEIDPGYAQVNIRPLGGPSPISTCSQESEEGGGYANPMDALNFPNEVIQKRLSMGPAALLDERPSGSGHGYSEGKQSSPYQSVEDVRKMRELQNNQRHHLRQSGKNRSHSVSPKASQTNLPRQQQEEDSNQVNYYDDNPGYSKPYDALNDIYSRPFDALTGGAAPKKVSTENSTKKAPFPPKPPAMRRTTSGDRPGKERAAKSLHMTTVFGKESDKTGPSDDNKNPVLRGGSCKKSWKVMEYINRANGSMTPPPLPPPSDRPKVKEQWQLPRQKQQEKTDKSYLRSRSDQSFQEELQTSILRGGVDHLSVENGSHPLRGETGRTASEGAMSRTKPKPPLKNIQQLKAKKLNTTRVN